jgi:hypothetical protein
MAKAKQEVDAVSEAPVEVAPVEAAPVEAETSKPSGQLIRAVYGRMVDPHTGLSFDVVPCELLKMTGWVKSQIEAGKLELV